MVGNLRGFMASRFRELVSFQLPDFIAHVGHVCSGCLLFAQQPLYECGRTAQGLSKHIDVFGTGFAEGRLKPREIPRVRHRSRFPLWSLLWDWRGGGRDDLPCSWIVYTWTTNS